MSRVRDLDGNYSDVAREHTGHEGVLELIFTGSADPQEAPGVTARIGSIYLRTSEEASGSVFYLKTNINDTSWQVVFPAD